jgi:arabinogalactan oligomer/maltooligosaccharide transport system permease protein
VTMPGLRPVAATVILLGLIWTFNMFAIIYLITGGGPGDSTQIFSTYAYKYAFEYKIYGVAAAYGVIILSILVIFSQIYRRTVARLGEETWA